jgi:hypothetical protein
LSQVAGKPFIPEDRLQSNLDGFGLLLDKLDSVSQEDDLLAGAELAEVVIHGADGNTGLACTCRQVDDAVAVTRVFDESGLEVAQIDLVFSIIFSALFFSLLLLLLINQCFVLLLHGSSYIFLFILLLFIFGHIFFVLDLAFLLTELQIRTCLILVLCWSWRVILVRGLTKVFHL